MAIPNKIEALLGFAQKSGKIIFGTDNILFYKTDKFLILCDQNLADNAQKKLRRYAEERKIPVKISQQPLSVLLHKEGVKAVAVTDPNLAAEILKITDI